MEVEKEKRDKLAAARKKLNEYKMSRSGNSGSASVAASQPADVPLFYQNINSSAAASVNIFNPAAGNNNFEPNNSYFVSSSSAMAPLVTTTAESTTKPEEPTVQKSFNFLPNPSDLFSKHNIPQSDKVDVVPFNLFSPIVPDNAAETQVVEGIFAGTELSAEENQTTSTDSDAGVVVPLFSAENVQVGLLSHPVGSPATVVDNQQSIPNSGSSLQGDTSSLLLEEGLQHLASTHTAVLDPTNEFSPSAPVLDLVSSEEIVRGPSTADESASSAPNSESHSNLNESVQSRIISVDAPSASPESAQEALELNGAHGMPVPLFASSLFGSTKSDFGKLGGIFNDSGNSQSLAFSNKTASTLHTENQLFADNSTETNQFISPLLHNSGSFLTTETINDPSVNAEISNASGLESELGEELQPGSPPDTEMGTHVYEAKDVEMNVADTSSTVNYNESSIPLAVNELLSTNTASANEESNRLQHEENALQKSIEEDTRSGETQWMRSVQEALELQIEELRRENAYLLGRQTELTFKIEESEKLAHEFKLEKDRVREEAATTTQALRARINSLCEENQRIVKNSTDIGVDLRAKLEEKSRQLEEMQKAVIIVSQSKMDFAGRLDHELERVKELQALLKQKDDLLETLRSENKQLQDKLKQEHQTDAIIHQLQDQARHYQVQCETLQKEVGNLRNKLRQQQDIHSGSNVFRTGNDRTSSHEHFESINESKEGSDNQTRLPHNEGSGNQEIRSCSDTHDPNTSHHDHSHACKDHEHHEYHDNQKDESHCNHDHSEDHHHVHNEKDHHHHHGEKDHHHHDHNGDHDHHHDHNHDHHHEHSHESDGQVASRREPFDEMAELKKTLHRLEWENSSFRNEMDILAVDAKQKRTYEEKCAVLTEENARLKREVEQLEHVIIQLQGENDTIGDYITLYQTQKMALKECAKEKDAQLEQLAMEREMLLHRLAELTALVKDLKDSKSEAGSQCADDHVHTFDSSIPSTTGNKRQIEGKIRDLLTEISSSSLIENFHPCAVCSGRLMTV